MTAPVKHTITEVDAVAFTEAIDKTDYSDATGTWPAGTIGAVVSDYGTMKEVEIADENGVPLDFPVVPVKKLKLVSKHSDRIAATNLSISATRQKKRRKPQRATAAHSSR